MLKEFQKKQVIYFHIPFTEGSNIPERKHGGGEGTFVFIIR